MSGTTSDGPRRHLAIGDDQRPVDQNRLGQHGVDPLLVGRFRRVEVQGGVHLFLLAHHIAHRQT